MSLRECVINAGVEINTSDAELLNQAIADGATDIEALQALASSIDGEQQSLAEQAGIKPAPSNVLNQESPLQQREGDGSLYGLPRNIEGFAPHHSSIVEAVAKTYMESKGLTYTPPSTYRPVYIDRSELIANEYEAMEHNPQDPEVKAAYDAMIAETLEQYQFILDSGLVVEFIEGADPYANNPRMVNDDVNDNNHMWVFPTNDGFGSGDLDVSDNPLLAETEFEISGQPALVNDIFRVVHDYFGHVKEGLGTRQGGEENAWRIHASMYTPLALRAMTTETRGQNSWVNYGPFGEVNRTSSSNDTTYAPQKIGLLPKWVSSIGSKDAGVLPETDQSVTGFQMVDPRSLVGSTIKPTLADMTGAGREFSGIDSSQIDENIELQGGWGFPMLESYFENGIVWAANNKSQITKLRGSDYVVVSAMMPDTHNSNATVAQAFFSTIDAYIRDKRINKTQAKAITALIKRTGKKANIDNKSDFAQFVGLEDSTAYHNWVEGLTFADRRTLFKALSSPKGQELGLPNFQKIMDSVIDGEHSGHNQNDSQLILQVEQGDNAIVELGTNGTKKHRSYKYGIKGKVIGLLPRPVPRAVLFPDFEAGYLARSEKGDKAWRSFDLQKPTQVITQEIADSIPSTPYISIRSPRQAQLALDFKRGVWRDSNSKVKDGGISATEYIKELLSSPYSSTFSDSTEADLAGAVIYQLGNKAVKDKGSRIFFALKPNYNYNLYKGVDNAEFNNSDIALSGVVSNETGANGVATPAVMLKALEEGATVLDAFAVPTKDHPDGFLPKIYGEFGFEAVESIEFDESLYSSTDVADMKNAWANDGWDESKGLPKLVIMKWRGKDEQRQDAKDNWINESKESVDRIETSPTDKYDLSAEKAFHSAERSGLPKQQRQAESGDGNGQLQSSKRPISSRLRGVLAELDGLSESELANLGIGSQFNQGSMGYYNPENTSIRLTETSNLSTFIHEFGHFMLDSEMKYQGENIEGIKSWMFRNIDGIAEQAGVSAEEVADFLNDYNSPSPNISAVERAVHEYFARGFEAYIMEGKAETAEIRGVFRKMMNWLLEAYKTIAFDRPNLDDEMVAVFDRMIVSHDKVSEVELASRYDHLFQSIEESGMTVEQFARYQNNDPADEAKEEVRDVLVQEITERFTKAWERERDIIAEDQAEKVSQIKVYQDIEALKGSLKMDRGLLKDIVGKIPSKLNGTSSLEGGLISPDDAAVALGYGSGEQMVKAIVDAPTIKQESIARADQIMLQKHGDQLNDGTIDALVEKALHNKGQEKRILAELRALGKGQRRIDNKVMKDAAENAVNKMTRRQLKPAKYRAAELRAAKKAAVALSKGDREGALAAKEKEVANFYLWRAIAEAKTEHGKFAKYGTKFRKSGFQKTVGKAGNEYLEHYGNVLSRVSIDGKPMVEFVPTSQDLGTWYRSRIAEEGDNLVFSEQVINPPPMSSDINEIPMSIIRGMKDALDNIEHIARYDTKVQIGEERIDLETAVDRAVSVIYDKNPIKYDLAQLSNSVEKRTLADRSRGWLAELTKIQWLQTWLDGGERTGVNFQLVMKPINDGVARKAQMFDEVVTSVSEAMSGLSRKDIKRHNTKIFIPEMVSAPENEVPNNGSIYGSQLIAIMLNTGNESNRTKMIKGEGWGDDYSMNNPVIQSVMRRITKEDMDFVQLVWNQMNMLQKPLFDTHRRVSGIKLEAVKSTPVETPHGTYTGGYYPVAYDYSRSTVASGFKKNAEKEAESAFGANGSLNPSVTAGATHERTGFFAPIRLNLDVVPRHFEETIHFIALREAVRDVMKVVKHDRYKKAVIETFGVEHYDLYETWLDDVARDGRQSKNLETVDDIIKYLQGGLTVGIMGFKASTILIQISGLSNSAAEVGAGNMLLGMKDVLFSEGSMKGAWEFATSRSKVLKHRFSNFDREIKNATKTFSGGTGIMDKIRQISMSPIGLMQTYVVDLPTWFAAYRQGLNLNDGNEAMAIDHADFVIQSVQGSAETKDMAQAFRNQGGATSMFTMFMTFFSSLTMTERDMIRGAKSGRYNIFEVARRFFFIAMIPVAYEAVMRMELGDDDPDEEVVEYLKKIAGFTLGGVPIIRDVASYVTTDYGYSLTPLAQWTAYTVPAVGAGLEALFKGEEPTPAQLRHMVKAGLIAFQIPASSQITTFMKAAEEGGSPYEFVMGMNND